MKNLDRTVVWRALNVTGTEQCTLSSERNGWRLAGLALREVDGVPAQASYTVYCDEAWQTREAVVELRADTTQRYLRLLARDGRWYGERGRELAALRGCLDVDIGFTPATNTLPIRRLDLAVGQSAEVTAAWVRFPEFTVEPLAQTYTRLDERRYRYESATGFVAEITVDDVGLVLRYEGGWERVD
ncbi:MAG: hypothetical protein OJF49_002621 [Ktedonobacterales bacterium]|nr:MAG: hypothetical protein OJF49_002621 [Ktedonobacterales bacterium]